MPNLAAWLRAHDTDLARHSRILGLMKHSPGLSEYVSARWATGHPMAGRNWYKTLVKWLLEYGFVQCESDPCYLKLIRDGKCLHIVVWVDDIISFCNDDELYAEYAAAFFGHFNGTDFGTDLHEWNSMRITQKPGEVKLDMQRYIEDVIADAFPGGIQIHYKYVTA